MKQKKSLRFLALFLTLLLLVTALPLSVFAAKVTEDFEEEETVTSDGASPSSDAERETPPLRDGNNELMEGIYQIRNAATDRYVQVNNAATGSGSVVGLTNEHFNDYGDHQQFLVRKVGNNEYTFQPLHALSMGVKSVGTVDAGFTIETYDPDAAAQRYSVTLTDDGYYVIRTKASNFQCLWSQKNGFGPFVTEQVYAPDPINGLHFWEQWDFEFSGPTSGVYALESYDTGKYANAVNNSQGTPVNVTNSGSRSVYQTTFANSPASSNSPKFTALFKLHYRPETQDYIIRNMMDNLLVLHHTNNVAKLVKRDYVTDSTTSSVYSWRITKIDRTLFYIWYKTSAGQTYYLTTPSSGGALTVVNNRSVATIWDFEEYTGTAKSIRPYYSYSSPDFETAHPGDQIDVSTKASPYSYSFYTTEIGVNTPGNKTYTVRNVNGTATHIASINISTGILTFDPDKCGQVRVTVTFVGGVSFYTDYYAAPTSNNIVVLQNVMGSVGYVKGFVTEFTTFATKASLTSGSFTDTQFWEKIQSPWTGYYYLKNVGNNWYLSAPDSTTMDADLVMATALRSPRCRHRSRSC